MQIHELSIIKNNKNHFSYIFYNIIKVEGKKAMVFEEIQYDLINVLIKVTFVLYFESL